MRFSVLLFALVAAACAPTRAASAMNASDLLAKRWTAQGLPGEEAQLPRLEFLADGRFAGYSGCNSVNGGWRLENGALRLEGLIMTKRACLGVGGDNERAFLAAVGRETTFTLAGGGLVAAGPDGKTLAFAAR
jgi:heat shock protein HslJ